MELNFQKKIFFFFFQEWKFYLNSAGTELPLVTLDKMTGSLTGNIIESFELPNKDRLVNAHALYRFL